MLFSTTEVMRSEAEASSQHTVTWHPHDFGARPKENLAFCNRILERFTTLRQHHGMQSESMLETAELLTTNTYE